MPPNKSTIQFDKSNELPSIEFQEYLFSNNYFLQELLPFKEGEERLISVSIIFFN